MADGTEKNDEVVKTDREEIFSKSVRAGKRTYFFDVKTTRRNDYYLTLTESKKRFNRDGRFYFEKHKIFLYKEDFEKFTDGLTEAIGYIKENAPEIMEREEFERNAMETAQPVAEEAIEQETVNEEAESETTETVDSAESAETTESSVEDEVGEPITENFSNVEFEDLEDTKKS
jgi:hypothetical protein